WRTGPPMKGTGWRTGAGVGSRDLLSRNGRSMRFRTCKSERQAFLPREVQTACFLDHAQAGLQVFFGHHKIVVRLKCARPRIWLLNAYDDALAFEPLQGAPLFRRK